MPLVRGCSQLALRACTAVFCTRRRHRGPHTTWRWSPWLSGTRPRYSRSDCQVDHHETGAVHRSDRRPRCRHHRNRRTEPRPIRSRGQYELTNEPRGCRTFKHLAGSRTPGCGAQGLAGAIALATRMVIRSTRREAWHLRWLCCQRRAPSPGSPDTRRGRFAASRHRMRPSGPPARRSPVRSTPHRQQDGRFGALGSRGRRQSAAGASALQGPQFAVLRPVRSVRRRDGLGVPGSLGCRRRVRCR